MSAKPAYPFERHLVAHFAKCLRAGQTPWGQVAVSFEFDYHGGIVDVLALGPDGLVLAFEAKLAKWRDALHQAYRTRCFANRAYVVLPAVRAQTAMRYEQEFRRRGVGLCAVSLDGGVQVLLETESGLPLQPWVTTRAIDVLSKRRRGKDSCLAIRSSVKSSTKSVRIVA